MISLLRTRPARHKATGLQGSPLFFPKSHIGSEFSPLVVLSKSLALILEFQPLLNNLFCLLAPANDGAYFAQSLQVEQSQADGAVLRRREGTGEDVQGK